jgi:hypothetical protein
MDREAVREVFLPRREDCLESFPMEGGGEVPVLRFFEDLGGWLHSEGGSEVGVSGVWEVF